MVKKDALSFFKSQCSILPHVTRIMSQEENNTLHIFIFTNNEIADFDLSWKLAEIENNTEDQFPQLNLSFERRYDSQDNISSLMSPVFERQTHA